MDIQTILMVAGGCFATFFGGKLLVKGDTRVENRRRDAVGMAAWCHSNGLPVLKDLLSSYAVGDYSGVLHQIGIIREIVSDADRAKEAVNKFLQVQLDARLNNSEGREELIAYVERKLNVRLDRNAITQAPAALSTPVSS